MPKFVAIYGVGGYMGEEEKEIFRMSAASYEQVIEKLFKKRFPTPKRKDYDDVEDYNGAVEFRNDVLDDWLYCTDELERGVWEMVNDDTGIIIVKVA